MAEEFELVRSKRRTIGMHIEHDGAVVVRAPMRMPMYFIEQFVDQKQDWLRRHRSRMLEKHAKALSYSVGSVLPYRGVDYPIVQSSGMALRVIFDDEFSVPSLNESQTKILIHGWYKKQSLRYLQQRINNFAGMMGLEYDRFALSSAQTRWGSCTGRASIRLNWRLICCPDEVIDYVVVHELAHITHHNHSHAFWQLVEETIPNYRQLRKWCRENGHILHI